MRKVFVELVAVFTLVLFLGRGAVSACAEGDLLNEFEPVWTNAAEQTAEAWFRTEDTRAVLTVFLALDYYISTDDSEILLALAGDSYVLLGAEGSDLMVMYYNDDVAYDISYHPENGTAECLGPMEYTEDDMERVLTSMQILGAVWYANSDEKMIEIEYLMLDVMMEDES